MRAIKKGWSNPAGRVTFTNMAKIVTCLMVLGLCYQCGSAEEVVNSHTRMIAKLSEIERDTDRTNRYLGTAFLETQRVIFEKLPENASLFALFDALVWLGIAELNHGFERDAIEHLERAMSLVKDNDQGIDGDKIVNAAEMLISACLRLGETENCCALPSPESCIFPLHKSAIHTNREGSERAVEHLSWLLKRADLDSEQRGQARWLLNLAYMTLGEQPIGDLKGSLLKLPAEPVPGPRTARRGSPVEFPAFKNIAASAGVDTFGLSGGAVADDLNGDGLIDLAVSNWDPSVSMSCFLNKGDGTFTKADANLDGIKGGLNMVQCDYDNDGDIDLFVTRGAWLKDAGKHPNSLLQNDGTGRFTDVTYAVGLAEPAYPTQTAGWADYDLDGDMDLFIGNEAKMGFDAPCQLFRNDGGQFIDVAKEAGVNIQRFVKGIGWGDYDGDGFPDLLLSCLGKANILMHNRGDGTFSNATHLLQPTSGPERSFPAWFFDYDNDGWLDIFVSSYASVQAEYLNYFQGGILPDYAHASLFHNEAGAGFIDRISEAALDRPMLPMGSNFGDLTNNGFPDIYLGSGKPDFDAIVPNSLFVNDEGRFFDLTMTSRMGHLQKGHAVAMADFDRDGDLDVFEQMGGALPADKFYDVLYENPGFGRHWLGVKLEGVKTNRFGVGCRVAVLIEEPKTGSRWIYQWMNSGGSFGANPLQLHFGLGEAESVKEVRVYWPVSDSTTVVESPGIDRILTVRESE